MVRCFIGILIPDEIKAKITKIQDEINGLRIKCKMVETENLHINLSFLGEVDENKIEEISKTLDEICVNFRKFEIEIRDLLIIPDMNYIRVLAIGISQDEHPLKKISQEIKQRIGGDVKPPHLTLCRVKQIENKANTIEELKRINTIVGNISVNSIHIVKSTLGISGPIYQSIHESKLL